MTIADTGFWLALANRADHYHVKAKQALSENKDGLITTWPVMTETCRLLLHRLGMAAELSFLRSLNEGAFEVFSLERHHYDRLEALMNKYRDLPMDLADASLVILAEELGKGDIFSTDTRDFRNYRWKNRKPFRNLLF